MNKLLMLGAILTLAACTSASESEFKKTCMADARVINAELSDKDASEICDCAANIIKLGARMTDPSETAFADADDAFDTYVVSAEPGRVMVLTNATTYCETPEMRDMVKTALKQN